MKLWTKPGRIFTEKEGEEKIHCAVGTVDIRLKRDERGNTLSLTFLDIMILVELTQTVINDIRSDISLRKGWTLRGCMFLTEKGRMMQIPITRISLMIARDNCDILELSTKGICIHTEAKCVCDHIRKYTRA